MFFELAPEQAILSDLNIDLINAYQVVADKHEQVHFLLELLPSTASAYSEIRGINPRCELGRAVRFIYLNRNCWGGLHRENRYGAFNTPWGGGERTHSRMLKDGDLARAAALLSRPQVKLMVSDFESPLDCAGRGDIVYCDPTYRSRTRRQFDRYGKQIFDWKDQVRLADAVWRAFERGAFVIVSNASCHSVRGLYQGAGLIRVSRPKGLGPQKSTIEGAEYLFVLDPSDKWADWSSVGTVIRRQSVKCMRRTSTRALDEMPLLRLPRAVTT